MSNSDKFTSASDIRQAGLDALARREHGKLELCDKLVKKGFDRDAVREVIETLAQQGLQCDWRFAESFTRHRQNQGYGPVRIEQELRQRKIPEEIIVESVDHRDPIWAQLCQSAFNKKFARVFEDAEYEFVEYDNAKQAYEAKKASYQLRAKQQRFLKYRGFTEAQIRQVLTVSC